MLGSCNEILILEGKIWKSDNRWISKIIMWALYSMLINVNLILGPCKDHKCRAFMQSAQKEFFFSNNTDPLSNEMFFVVE